MNDVLNQNGFRAEIMQQEGAPTILRCEAMRQGKVAKDVVIEACFIPMQLPDENMGLLQFFVTLFQGAPEEHKVQLHRACDYCNGFCALGAFGFYEQAGQIYLKHNTLIDGSLELDKIIPFVADNISVLLAAVSRFIDGLAQVAYAGLYITECGFFRDSTDCSGFKNLTLAEECFGVFMDYRLIHARKVKVNIRLFIALKSKECFKRNIVAVFSVLRSAFRTHLIGQVTPRQTNFRLNKLYVFTIWANIVTLK